MIRKIKDKIRSKKYFINMFIVELIIIFCCYSSIIWFFFAMGFKENSENIIAENYKDVDSRKKYFNDNKIYLDNLVELLTNYNQISSIESVTVCPDYTYFKGKMFICSSSKIKNLPVKKFYNNFKKTDLDSIVVKDDEIIFKFIRTPEYKIWYYYCLLPDNCGYVENFEENSSGIWVENVIDEHWSVIYTDIPTR